MQNIEVNIILFYYPKTPPFHLQSNACAGGILIRGSNINCVCKRTKIGM